MQPLTILNAEELQKIIAEDDIIIKKHTKSKYDQEEDVLKTEVRKADFIYTAHYTEIVAHAT